MVDVQTEIIIHRPVKEVAEYAMDPDNAPQWYVNIQSSKWVSEPPLVKGSQIAFKAQFLGKTLEYIYEVTELIPLKKLVMKTAEGPFPMETIYTFSKSDGQSTQMTLRNRGNPKGFSKVFAPLMVRMMRKANEKDLISIKKFLENA